MFNLDEIEKETNQIYTILNTKKCFQKSNYNERYFPQLLRNVIQFRIISRKLLIYEKKFPEYLGWYNKNLPEFPLKREDFVYEVVTLTCNHALATFELLKRFLLNTLELTEINKKSNLSLSQISMLGDVVKSIKKTVFINQDRVDKLINIEFRNTLAHDSWYLKNNQFMYKDMKGKDRQWSLQELYENANTIQCVYKTISDRYAEDFYPEYIQEYKDSLGDVLDRDFPMSPK